MLTVFNLRIKNYFTLKAETFKNLVKDKPDLFPSNLTEVTSFGAATVKEAYIRSWWRTKELNWQSAGMARNTNSQVCKVPIRWRALKAGFKRWLGSCHKGKSFWDSSIKVSILKLYCIVHSVCYDVSLFSHCLYFYVNVSDFIFILKFNGIKYTK